jgi:hypothetical protein
VPFVSPRVASRLLATVRMPVPARFVGLTRNVLVPGWIMIFGCVLLIAQPLSVSASLLLCVVGLLVVPARALIPAAARK